MSQTLVLELSDETYAAIQHRAEVAGISPAYWLSRNLEQQYGLTPARLTAEEHQAARERFEQHFGKLEFADAVGADNAQIDAELAKEYGDSHEAS
ncbi:hypothetical protein [Candidatus Entotheonella palauensis]|uniref:hypothetical protein n=1 Tax=Candidatus Entotheonella palauensis TaxID=93172 RepID=UPI000B7ECFC0|nr:hypothetical protein [Candidatus Entotheonella palauensis]